MDNLDLTDQGMRLFSFDGARSAVESAASNPKVAAVVATSTASMGMMAKLELMQSVIGMASLCIGFITGCVVLAIQTIKLIRVYKLWDPNKRRVIEVEE